MCVHDECSYHARGAGVIDLMIVCMAHNISSGVMFLVSCPAVRGVSVLVSDGLVFGLTPLVVLGLSSGHGGLEGCRPRVCSR